MSEFIVPGLEFEQLAALARDDPEQFERLRTDAVRRVLDRAPEPLRSRLEGLQWRIDLERERADTPLNACARISEMMWEQLLGPEGLLDQMRTLGSAAHRHPRPRLTATILPFGRDGDDDPPATADRLTPDTGSGRHAGSARSTDEVGSEDPPPDEPGPGAR